MEIGQKKVAFVPEKYFYTAKSGGLEIMCLNFTMMDNKND